MSKRIQRNVKSRLCYCALILWVAAAHLGGLAAAASNEVSRGSILVADESLRDPNFRETLVLIVGHDNLGTIGLIINRPTPITIEQSLPAIAERVEPGAAVYFGGPVEVEGFRMLAQSQTTVPDAVHVMEDVYFIDNPQALDYVLDDETSSTGYRFFAGISGWIPGQLAMEIRAGGWKVVPFDSELVLSEQPEKLWPRIIERLRARWVGR